MTKGIFVSAAITVAWCTVAVTNAVHGQSGQMDDQTAELIRFIESESELAPYDASPASASMLEFVGGELQAYVGKDQKSCGGCCPATFVGGVDLLMLRPHVHGNRYHGSFAIVEGDVVDSRDHPMDNMTFSPRI